MYLQHMIRSMLKQLQLGETDQTLLSFIDKAMKVEERKKLLESHYSQELSLLYILQEDYDRAKYYTNYAMQLFMEVCRYTAFLSITSKLKTKRSFIYSLYTLLIAFSPIELLECRYAADSKSADHPAVGAGLDWNPGLSAFH